jgi:hypothetical protein
MIIAVDMTTTTANVIFDFIVLPPVKLLNHPG